MPLTGAGALCTRETLRRIEKILCAERMPEGFAPDEPAPKRILGARELYLGGVAQEFAGKGAACRMPVLVCARDEALLALAQDAFAAVGRGCRCAFDEEEAPGAGEMGAALDGEGRLIGLADSSAALRGEMLGMLLLWTALERGEREIPLAQGAPQAMGALCGEYGAQVVPTHSGEELGAMAERAPTLLRLHTDGIFAALAALDALEARALQLWDWQSLLPRMAVLTQTLPVESARKGRILRALAEQFPQAELGDGVRIRTGEGRAWVRPSSDSAECYLSCEAADMETAQQLLERCRRIIGAEMRDKK